MHFGGLTSIGNVLDPLFAHMDPVRASTVVCSSFACNFEQNGGWETYTCILEDSGQSRSIAEWVGINYVEHENHRCTTCGLPLACKYRWLWLPSLLVFNIGGEHSTLANFEPTFSLKDEDNNEKVYSLQGIIYYSQAHFTAHIWNGNDCWLYDGASMQNRMVLDTQVPSIDRCPVVAALYSC